MLRLTTSNSNTKLSLILDPRAESLIVGWWDEAMDCTRVLNILQQLEASLQK